MIKTLAVNEKVHKVYDNISKKQKVINIFC